MCGVRDDLPPDISAACTGADPLFMSLPLPDSASERGGGRERIQIALTTMGDLLNSVVAREHRTADLIFARADLNRAGDVLNGVSPQAAKYHDEVLRMQSACALTVGSAIVALLEYLCGGSFEHVPHLLTVWEGACKFVHRALGTTEHLYPEHAENATIVESLVSVARGILVSQPKRSVATKTVLALVACTHRSLWDRVSDSGHSARSAEHGAAEDDDEGHDTDSDSDEPERSVEPEPPAKADSGVLVRMASPSRHLYKTAKHDGAALHVGLGIQRAIHWRDSLKDMRVIPAIVSYLYMVGVTTPLAYGVQVLKLAGGAVIAANHRLGSYRALYQSFVEHYAANHEDATEPPCSLTTFYRIASALTPKRVQVP